MTCGDDFALITILSLLTLVVLVFLLVSLFGTLGIVYGYCSSVLFTAIVEQRFSTSYHLIWNWLRDYSLVSIIFFCLVKW